MTLDHGFQPRARPLFDANGPSLVTLKTVRSHPAFAGALRAAADGTVRLFQGNRLLNTVVNDRGRLVIGYMSLYIHYFGLPDDPEPGLTVSRVRRICVAQGICSPGRAEAMLVIMRLFGYLEPAPSSGDRRRRLLVPTPRLIGAHHERWRILFRAMLPIFPEAAAALDALQNLDFTRALVRQFGDHFLAGVRVLDYAPGLVLFAERNAGVMIMLSLLLAGASDDTTPPVGPVTVSISALARRFGVSRVHVRKLLRDAEAQNYLRRTGTGEGHVVLLPRFKEAAENFMATAFLFLLHCARAAMQEMEARAAQTA